VAGKDLGYAGPAQAASPPAPARRRRFWRELAFLLLLAAVLTVAIKAFAVEAFRIPSGSMENTLRVDLSFWLWPSGGWRPRHART
jgi:signal peptidase I